MSAPLEDTLRALAKKGDLNHISLIFDPIVGFSAMYRPARSGVSEHFADKDPVKAVLGAVHGRKKAERLVAKAAVEAVKPPEPQTLYWYHPESGSLFTTMDNEPRPNEHEPLCEEIDETTYRALERALVAEVSTPAEPAPVPTAPPSDFEDLL